MFLSFPLSIYQVCDGWIDCNLDDKDKGVDEDDCATGCKGDAFQCLTAHELGIVTYEQIAAFPQDYISKLDDYLSFDGRIERDGWVAQAAELAQTRPAKTGELPELPDETPDNATAD